VAVAIVGFNSTFGDTVKNSFFLVIPRQQNEPKRLKEFETKALQQWLDELPAANLGLATRLIHDFVIEMNKLTMPSQVRLDALERIRPNVIVIEDFLQDRLIKAGFPKEDNEKKIFDVLISIQKECAIGYWCILKELTHRDAGWFKGKNTALATQRCIKKLGRIVTSHFIMRIPAPDWVWIDLHSLYKLSVRTDQNRTLVSKQLNQFNNTHTAEECYHQVLLMSLADVTGLMQREIPEVYQFIESIASLISLRATPMMSQKSQCVILTDEDKSPYFQSNIDIKGDSSCLYIDFTRLYKLIEQQKNPSQRTDSTFLNTMLSGMQPQSTKLQIDLLSYLQQRWFGIELQGSALFSDRQDRCITIGLSAIHSTTSSLDKDITESLPKDTYTAQSASDRLLSTSFNDFGILSVGNLISFKKKDEFESSRSLGIVNKLSVLNQAGKVLFGVHLLAGYFYTVICKQRPGTTKEVLQKGIYYTTKNRAEERNFVITDYFMFEDGDLVYLTMNWEEFPVLMKNRKNIGLGYWQFECQRLAEEVSQVKVKTGYDFI
jgi:cyclic-di-GMP-binding protein